MMSRTSMYFVYQDQGGVLFFKDFVENNARIFHEYLTIMKKKYQTKKLKINQIDLTENLPQLSWNFIRPDYKFSFNPKS